MNHWKQKISIILSVLFILIQGSSLLAGKLHTPENYKHIKTQLELKFRKNRYPLGGAGSMKYIYPIDANGDPAKPDSKDCYAFAISQSPKGRDMIINEVCLLNRLQEEGLSVVPTYKFTAVEDAIISVSDTEGPSLAPLLAVGYVMDWIPNAVQLEAKTVNMKLTLSTLIGILIHEGKNLDSTEMGRIRNLQRIKNFISHAPSFILNESALLNMIHGMKELLDYPNCIVDLQFLVDKDSGVITVIDPLDILTTTQLEEISPDSDLMAHIQSAKLWLNEIYDFLIKVQELSGNTKAIKELFLTALR